MITISFVGGLAMYRVGMSSMETNELLVEAGETDNKFTLFNANDPYYHRTFDSIYEYVAWLQNLIDSGNRFFVTDYRLLNVSELPPLTSNLHGEFFDAVMAGGEQRLNY